MERTDKQENNRRRREGRQGFSAACQFSVWLHEQVDDPPEPQCHEKSQKENDSSTKLVVPGVGSGGEQANEDVQPNRLGQTQSVDVERGADKPAPQHHSHKSSEKDVDDDKEEVAGDAASLLSSVVSHDTSLSSPRRSACVFSQEKHCSTPGWRVSKMRFHDAI